ncbi:carbamoylphosphate synthase large subunit [Coniella lustricola]|uniref:Carbamoylphosphate synthase large subunit n=1 Tax=Coniella lustricola TaxID=2025994 RepID=A0A2T2ZUC1_9PEZI|nr:carbamoylphosphate synthase large subunit [Coniella lustricola]
MSSRQRLGFTRLSVHDHLKTAALVFISLVTLPVSYLLAILMTTLPQPWLTYLFPSSMGTPAAAAAHREQCRSAPGFRRYTVLVTGVGMTKGLTVARAFWLCGHRVIGAEFQAERCGMWTLWGDKFRSSFSKAFDSVYSLKKPEIAPESSEMEKIKVRKQYAQELCTIIRSEGVDLWVSCSSVGSALEDAYVKEVLDSFRVEGKDKHCASIQFGTAETAKLHEKSTFIKHANSLGLLAPETHDVFSQHDVFKHLDAAATRHAERKFILKPVGMDDAHRGNMTLLPLATPAETQAHVQRLPISQAQPWILQQFISGNKEYCTHALVVDGVVKVFAACPSSEMLMHYTALPSSSNLTRDMLNFTKTVALHAKKRGGEFTGHLSFDFMAETGQDGQTKLYAIECNPRAHTAVALFGTPGSAMREMVDAYISAIDSHGVSKTTTRVSADRKESGAVGIARPAADTSSRYWLGHDIFALVLLPVWGLVTLKTTGSEVQASLQEAVAHLSTWKEGSFELWDPWPFVALYHHYWPSAILSAWWQGQRWSRLNVSTTKMFAC